jgi:hypothetical protein
VVRLGDGFQLCCIVLVKKMGGRERHIMLINIRNLTDVIILTCISRLVLDPGVVMNLLINSYA